MIVYSPISTCAKNFACLGACVQRQMATNICSLMSRGPSSSFCFYLYPANVATYSSGLSGSETLSCLAVGCHTFRASCFRSGFSNQKSNFCSLTIEGLVGSRRPQSRCLKISLSCQNTDTKLLVPKQGMLPKIKCDSGPMPWPQRSASAGLIFGLLVCGSSSEPVHAEASQEKGDKEADCDDRSHVKFSHGKEVYTDYSITGIPGDGRCLFRSVAHGACLRSGKPAPSESQQKELADELRARVADEFIKRRKETEWFVEGDFDAYVSEIRKPRVWGGEPELFMASHVLQMPITVYMYDEDAGGLISIAEYGQEYGKGCPIRVLYHGFGHYEALQIPGKKDVRSRI